MQYFGEKPGFCLQEYDRQNVLIGDRQRIRKQYNRVNPNKAKVQTNPGSVTSILGGVTRTKIQHGICQFFLTTNLNNLLSIILDKFHV